MKTIEKELVGRKCEVFVYGRKMRFYCAASFYLMEDDRVTLPQTPPAGFGMLRYQSGALDIWTTKLVPYTMNTDELDALADSLLNEMESVFCIPEGCASSSGWNAGHKDSDYDDLLSEGDRAYLNKYTD